MKKIKCGVIGCGLMGREFAAAVARWPALLTLDVRPEIIAICDLNKELFPWYTANFDSISLASTEYHELLDNQEIEFIYCAVPHHLHEKIYIDIIRAGKHLMAEKPFGIDKDANRNILRVIDEYPERFVRCSSEFPYYPGAWRIQKLIGEHPWGRIIEVNAGFLHSSDINDDKPINWKRIVALNGEYGCLGDLGMHVLHLPLRLGWFPHRLFASLSNIVTERPDQSGQLVPCETWDNASLCCLVRHPQDGYEFPMNLKTWRIAPGEINTWYIEILGTKFSARFSTKNPKTLEIMNYINGGKQEWRREDLGYESVYKTITGGIFEFGFPDAILQMWAAFIDEYMNRPVRIPYGCVRPEETYNQHHILSAALESHRLKRSVDLKIEGD